MAFGFVEVTVAIQVDPVCEEDMHKCVTYVRDVSIFFHFHYRSLLNTQMI